VVTTTKPVQVAPVHSRHGSWSQMMLTEGRTALSSDAHTSGTMSASTQPHGDLFHQRSD
jgi:hypothetical protein